jgi:DNA-binding transcriptional ArsR family regulator
VLPANLLLLIAEPRREMLLRTLWHGERTAGELRDTLPEISFSAVSQHLRKLREAGLVRVKEDGRRRIYRVERSAFGPLAEALDHMWAKQLDRLKELAEEEAGRRREEKR